MEKIFSTAPCLIVISTDEWSEIWVNIYFYNVLYQSEIFPDRKRKQRFINVQRNEKNFIVYQTISLGECHDRDKNFILTPDRK